MMGLTLPAVLAGTGALTGSTSAALATLLAAAGETATSSGGTNLAPFVQGGGSAAAVAGLVYFARMVLRGDLVAKPTAEREAELAAAVRATAERETAGVRREEALTLLVQQAAAREDALRKALTDVARLSWEHERTGGAPSDRPDRFDRPEDRYR